MKKTLYLLVFAAAIPLIWLSCQKSASYLNPVLPPAPEYITTSVEGRIVDESKVPVSGAVVKAGTASSTTDVNGNFNFTDIQLDKNTGCVVVEKAGYFNGSRTITSKANATNHIEIQLIPKAIAGTFAAASGGSITVPSGGSISFTANSIVNTATNTAYTGTVSLAAFFLNPSSSSFGAIMPGTLRGLTTANEQRGLQSFGMMAVELIGAAGEKLQIASGKTATIKFPITTGLQSQAPATIPLWYFDEASGWWKEEGSATKQGNDYVGTVSHFSFWNCDAPFPTIDFEATFKDQGGSPVVAAKVVLRNIGDSITISGTGYTNTAGTVNGRIPSNKILQLLVYDRCGDMIHTQNVGPFNTNTNLGVTTINVNVSTSVTISGTAVNCSGQPVTNGYVNIFLDGANNRANINNGNFSITISRCTSGQATGSVTAVDLAAATQSTPADITVAAGNVNAGALTACGTSISQFINYKVNNIDYAITMPGDSISFSYSNNISYINGSTISNPNDKRYITFSFPGNGTGTYALDYVYALIPNAGQYVKNGAISVAVTEYGSVGGFVAGNFTGMVRDSSFTSPAVPINCTFRVKRWR